MSSLTFRQHEKGLPPSTAGGQVYSPCASLRLPMPRSMRSFLATRHPNACRYSFAPLQAEMDVMDVHDSYALTASDTRPVLA